MPDCDVICVNKFVYFHINVVSDLYKNILIFF